MITSRQAIAQFQVAMMLLTRLPAGNLTAPIPRMRDAVWAFPMVGLVVGAVGAVVLALALWAGVSPTVAAGLSLIASALATGALHEDGLADVADGFGGGQTRARKLEIMRDSRIGSYGTLALILAIGMRWQAMGFVAGVSPFAAICSLVAISIISRAGLPAMMVALPAARPDGLGRSAAGGNWTGAVVAATIGMVAGGVALGPIAAVAVAMTVAIVLAAFGRLAMRQIGGQTGDVLGAAQQLSDVAAWVVLSALVAL